MCDKLRAGEVLELRVLPPVDISGYQGGAKNKHSRVPFTERSWDSSPLTGQRDSCCSDAFTR